MTFILYGFCYFYNWADTTIVASADAGTGTLKEVHTEAIPGTVVIRERSR